MGGCDRSFGEIGEAKSSPARVQNGISSGEKAG
jgi:hypothetical protein